MQRSHYKLSDYLILSMLAALGIAIKSIIVPLAQIITGPLFIPGGVLAGGFYMMFLVLGQTLVGKRGSAFMVSLIQAVLVTITGTLGSHGAVSLFTYTFSGMAVELWFMLSRHRGCCALCCFIGGMVANMAGSFAVNLAIFKLPFVPLMLSICIAALSGGLGGLVARMVALNLEKTGVLSSKSTEPRGNISVL
ncbi:MAG: ECF transporter S component [Bacillota bacterium]|nr:ECF transporter S component [Bacillota bacterium]HHU62061.1 ECF transporter S component [Natronincola sp.]